MAQYTSELALIALGLGAHGSHDLQPGSHKLSPILGCVVPAVLAVGMTVFGVVAVGTTVRIVSVGTVVAVSGSARPPQQQ